MDALCVATFLPHEALPADCMSPRHGAVAASHTHTASRFAFVEYESRRDADDAYHEMHNKRLGRDDVLKIEVRSSSLYLLFRSELNSNLVGPYASFRILAV